MRKIHYLSALLLTCFMIMLSGCGGGGGGPTTWTGIEGYVTSGRGDNVLANVTVELYSVGSETTGTYLPAIRTFITSVQTDSAGYYHFTDLSTGQVYEVEIPSSSGRPGARFQHLIINNTDEHLRADLIVRPNFPASTTVGLPSVVSITDAGGLIVPGQTLTGNKILTVTVQAGDAALPIKNILVKLGHLSNGSNIVSEDGSTSVAFNWDTTKMGNGDSFIYAIVYDINDNAAIVQIPVVIQNTVSGSAPGAPEIVRVEAWTFAETNGIKSAKPTVELPPIKVNRNGHYTYLPSRTSLAAGARALSSTSQSVMVHIQVAPSSDATGYRIYRGNSATGSFTLLGTRMNDPAFYEDAYYLSSGIQFDALWFNDLDPALTVNSEYYYKVAAVNAAGETDSGNTYHVKILPRFTVDLSTPANNAVNIDSASNPPFSWTAAGGVGNIGDASFIIYALNKDDESTTDFVPFSWLRAVYGKTDLQYADVVDGDDDPYDFDIVTPVSLKRGAVYEWDLLYAASGQMYSEMIFGESYAQYISYPRVDKGSTNGAFIFTTAP